MSSLFAMAGRLVGSYIVIRKLGEGGMGVVYGWPSSIASFMPAPCKPAVAW